VAPYFGLVLLIYEKKITRDIMTAPIPREGCAVRAGSFGKDTSGDDTGVLHNLCVILYELCTMR
jgi:hypothetical protein